MPFKRSNFKLTLVSTKRVASKFAHLESKVVIVKFVSKHDSAAIVREIEKCRYLLAQELEKPITELNA